ncbi:MAG: serine/threonine protein kinase [Sandaracinaceae bacterium]|nr:serine/threonine protein kinase [Sandaracinaceae bacterium]
MAGEPGEARERSYFGSGAKPGEVIAERYRVVREIGAGGMGQVVEVEHLDLEKRFALKLIRPDRWDESLDARFRREARALAKVSSPRVAGVTDFGVDDERGPFYVMELVEGEALHDVIRREGPLGRERALEIAIGIAEALADVHDAGLVHRDVKPGNIGICDKGPVEVRLLDFGLATSADERFGSRITESHRVVGSMPYMAPEQFHGEAPTPRVDLWALGIVLYEMLSGQLPFDAPTTAALIQKILNESPPPLPVHGQGGLLARLLAKDAALRPPTAQAAIELIEDAIVNPSSDESSIPTAEATRVEPVGTPVKPSSGLRVAGVVLAGIGLTALGGAVGTWSTRVEPEPTATETVEVASPPEVEVAPAAEAPALDSEAQIAPPAVVVEAPPAAAPEEVPVAPVARARRRAAPETPEVREAPEARSPETPPVAEVPSEREPEAWDGTIIESPSR